jgi:hypothetical protein
MPFNGSGTFNRVHNWQDDADNSIDIEPDRHDEEDDGFATGLSGCLTKDGQTNPSANLPMNGFKHTGVANATARNHYATVDQIQDNEYVWVDGGGTADAITATYSPAVTAVVDGMELKVRATAANATTTPTFSPNGLTARTITKNGGSALAVGDIAGDNHELTLRYYAASTRWELLNPAVQNTIPYIAASASGPASLDFAEDTDNGSNKVTLKAPASLAGDVDVTLPGTAGTLALTSAIPPFTAASASGPASLDFAEDTDNGSNKVVLKAPASLAGDVDVVLPSSAGTLALTSAIPTNYVKGWAKFTGTTLTAGNGITSMSNGSTGNYTVTIPTQADANYAPVICASSTSDGRCINMFVSSALAYTAPTTTAFIFSVADTGNTARNADYILIHLLGN